MKNVERKQQHWALRPGLWLFHRGHPRLARFALKPYVWWVEFRLGV